MRFAAVVKNQPPALRTPGAELFRRLVGLKPPVEALPPKLRDDLPPDLDQRVRLVGEW